MNQKTYDKYLRKYDPNDPKNIKAKKEMKVQQRKQWWSQNWIGFSGLVLAIISIAISIFALLR